MRPLSFVTLPLLLLAGCLGPAVDDGLQEGQGAPNGQKQVLLGDHQVFTPGPGEHEFAVVVSGAVASFQAEVTGWVLAS